jgi:hypothetical protein
VGGVDPENYGGLASMKGGFPIAGYNELNVNEGADKLDGLTEEHLKTVREYENATRTATPSSSR